MSDLPDIPMPESGDGGTPPIGDLRRPGKQVAIPWRLVSALVVFALVVTFALQNTDSVDVSFLFWDFGVPLIVVIVATMAASVVFGDLLDWWWRRRRKKHKDES